MIDGPFRAPTRPPVKVRVLIGAILSAIALGVTTGQNQRAIGVALAVLWTIVLIVWIVRVIPSAIDERTSATFAEGAPPPKRGRFCSNCGAQLHGPFCHGCGAQAGAPLQERDVVDDVAGAFRIAVKVLLIPGILGGAIWIGSKVVTGQSTPISCTVGVNATQASVTVRGLDARSWCDSLMRQTVAGYRLAYQGPAESGNPIVCNYTIGGSYFTVHDSGAFKIVGNAICLTLGNTAKQQQRA